MNAVVNDPAIIADLEPGKEETRASQPSARCRRAAGRPGKTPEHCCGRGYRDLNDLS